MKRIAAIILLIVATKFVSAQEVDPLSFFPSAVGNLWEYSTKSGTASYSIVKDSISEDGSKFIFFTHNDDPNYRIDTQYNVYWQPLDDGLNWHYYKLDADSGDIWIVDTIIAEVDTGYMLAQVDDKYPSLVFGQETVSMKITYYDYQADTTINEFSWPRFTMTIAAGFGELVETLEEPPDGPQKILQGCFIDGIKYGNLTAVDDENNILPNDIKLYQNYPNPFNPSTVISWQLAVGSNVQIKIYDLLGRKIKTLTNQYYSFGKHSITFNADELTSGTYFYRLITNSFIQTKKMMLIL